MVDLHIQLHQLVDIEWFHCATGCRAQCVADEVAHMMIFDYGWEGRECLALFRSFQILLDGCQTFPARTVEQVEQHLQGVQIKLARESGPLENAGEALADLLQEVRRVGDQHGPGSRARDDHQLGGLQQHKQVPFSIRYPAMIAPNTTTIPIIENMCIRLRPTESSLRVPPGWLRELPRRALITIQPCRRGAPSFLPWIR